MYMAHGIPMEEQTELGLSRKERLAALRRQRLENAGVAKKLDAKSAVSSPQVDNGPEVIDKEGLVTPSFQISDVETVEVLASKEQARIFSALNAKAVQAAAGTNIDSNENKTTHSSGTEDLKRDLMRYADAAQEATNASLQRLVQEAFLLRAQ